MLMRAVLPEGVMIEIVDTLFCLSSIQRLCVLLHLKEYV
jgi:hypothetical protein